MTTTIAKITPWTPSYRAEVEGDPEAKSAWRDVPPILPALLDAFNVKRDLAVNIGVWNGYSTSVLAGMFAHVIAIDHFEGDTNSGVIEDPESHFLGVRSRLKRYPNVYLIKESWQNVCRLQKQLFPCVVSLVHVDIDHSYEQTLACGLWAASLAPVVLFHDTCEFLPVMRALAEISLQTRRRAYNLQEKYGLGILTSEPVDN